MGRGSTVLRTAMTGAGIAAGVFALGCYLVAPRKGNEGWDGFDGRRFAHRGLFDQPRSASRAPHDAGIDARPGWERDVKVYGRPVLPENSLSAFRRAVQLGFGAELDVHLTRDGRLAVVHDSDLLRVCGRPGIVEQLTSEELGVYRLLGTQERIPFLEEVLPLFESGGASPDGRRPLIVEVKAEGGNAASLTAATVGCLDRFDVPWCIESFDPRVLIWLRRNRPEVVRGQLAEDFLQPGEGGGLKPPVRFALTNLLLDFLTRPDFIAYRYEDRRNLAAVLSCRLLGGHQVSWTIRDQGAMMQAEDEGNTTIFERFVPSPRG